MVAERRLRRSTEMTRSDCTGGSVARIASIVAFPQRPQDEDATKLRRRLQQHVHHVAVVGISVRAAVARDDIEIVGARDDALREQKAGDEFLVVAGSSHRDAEADATEPDLERFFYGEVVLTFGDFMIPHLDNTMTNGGNAPRNF
jgi:hypothetical protein